jgi:hypothetical protein
MVDTYGKTWWREGYACGCMIQSIEDVVEPRLKAAGYHTPINIFQQAYNSGGVSASAGTHDGGGALDHDRSSEGETRIWREGGWADWRRGSPYDSMDQHNHGIVIGCPHVSSGAADQVNDYKNGRNGLSGGGADPGPDVPYITWEDAYEKYANQKPAEPEGLFGMTKRVSSYRGDSQTFQTDNWNKTLGINKEGHATIAVNTKGMCDMIIYVTGGVEKGEEISFRWQYLGTKGDSTNVDWQSSVISYDKGPNGDIQLVCHWDLKPHEDGWDHKLRLAVNTHNKKVTFGVVELKGWED